MEGDYFAAPRPIRESDAGSMDTTPAAGCPGWGRRECPPGELPPGTSVLECPGGRYHPQGACRARMVMEGDYVAAPRSIKGGSTGAMAATPAAGCPGWGRRECPPGTNGLECPGGRYAQQGAWAAWMDMDGDCVAAPRPIRESGTGAMDTTPGSAGGPATGKKLECTRGRYSPQCA